VVVQLVESPRAAYQLDALGTGLRSGLVVTPRRYRDRLCRGYQPLPEPPLRTNRAGEQEPSDSVGVRVQIDQGKPNPNVSSVAQFSAHVRFWGPRRWDVYYALPIEDGNMGASK